MEPAHNPKYSQFVVRRAVPGVLARGKDRTSTRYPLQLGETILSSPKKELDLTLARQAEALELDPLESPAFAYKQRIRSESDQLSVAEYPKASPYEVQNGAHFEISFDTMVLKHKKSRGAAWIGCDDTVHFVGGEMRSLRGPSSGPRQSIFVQKQAIRIQFEFADGLLSGQGIFDFNRK